MYNNIQKLFNNNKKQPSPGSLACIIENGEIVFTYSYGMADLERNVAITRNSVFDIASISKQFVATCVLVLVNQGKLSLDDEIKKYISDFRRFSNSILIKHLLYHTSGILDYMDLLDESRMYEGNRYSRSEILKIIINSKKTAFNPGDQFSYSNSGYFLLGEIIQIITGESLSEYASKTIFKPLGMNNSLFNDNSNKIIKNRVLSYSVTDLGDYENFPYIFDIVGDTGLLTTIDDLLLWENNYYDNKINNNDKSLINQLSIGNTLNNGDQTNYAGGLFIAEYNGLQTIGHSGMAAGYLSEMIKFPELNISIICLSNFTGMTSVVYKMADIYFKDKKIKSK